MKKVRNRLNDYERAFVTRELACFGSPKDVAEALKQEFAVEVTPQAVERYDPTKRAGKNLSEKWREIFHQTREAFLAHFDEHIPLAHKAVRVRKLARAANYFERTGNYMAMARLLEQIAKEMGDAYTNRREFTGKSGGPIKYQDVADMTGDQIEAELRLLGVDLNALKLGSKH